jgi:hypothetical protein
MNENEKLDPQMYFDMLKNKKHRADDVMLDEVFNNCQILLDKFKKTGQKRGMRKIIFHLENIVKEREAVKLGIDTFIYRDDIEEYIDSVADDAVKIIELEEYERDIPDEIVDAIVKTKHIFTKYYVLFTDYTGKIERQVEKERQRKDPIIFATFQDEKSRSVIDRFYFIGDWEDEYCDLTLDKMVNQFKANNKDIVRKFSTPHDIESLKAQVDSIEPHKKDSDLFVVSTKPEKKRNIFQRVLSAIKNET